MHDTNSVVDGPICTVTRTHMHIHTHTYIYIHVYTLTNTFLHFYTRAAFQADTSTVADGNTCTHAHIHRNTYIYIHIFIHIYKCEHTSAGGNVNMFWCSYVYISVHVCIGANKYLPLEM